MIPKINKFQKSSKNPKVIYLNSSGASAKQPYENEEPQKHYMNEDQVIYETNTSHEDVTYTNS